MVRYIKAEDLIFGIDNTPTPTGFLSVDYIKGMIDALPAEDVAPIIHAYWIDTEDYTNHYGHIYECSNCHREVADDFIAKHTYCLHCGAKMDEEEEE